MSGVRWSVEDGVCTIAMDEPEKRNALSDALLDALLEAFSRARDTEEARCVVLASTHPRTWSAGGDLGGFTSDAPLSVKHAGIARFPALFRAIGTLGKPVIAAVGGHCLAGAFGLALACDLIVCTESAQFGTPELNVGVFPFMIAALIQRNLPRKKATELMLLGDRISAAEASSLGLVNRVVGDGELDAAVGEWATKLASRSPLLMRMGKDALWRQQDLGLEDAWDFLRSQLALSFATEDIREGVSAFFEQREPRWSGR